MYGIYLMKMKKKLIIKNTIYLYIRKGILFKDDINTSFIRVYRYICEPIYYYYYYLFQ